MFSQLCQDATFLMRWGICQVIREFLTRPKRLRLEMLPAWAPEWNPVGAIWSWLKSGEMANFIPTYTDDLDEEIVDPLIGLKFDPRDPASSSQHRQFPGFDGRRDCAKDSQVARIPNQGLIRRTRTEHPPSFADPEHGRGRREEDRPIGEVERHRAEHSSPEKYQKHLPEQDRPGHDQEAAWLRTRPRATPAAAVSATRVLRKVTSASTSTPHAAPTEKPTDRNTRRCSKSGARSRTPTSAT